MSTHCRLCGCEMPKDRKGWEQVCPECIKNRKCKDCAYFEGYFYKESTDSIVCNLYAPNHHVMNNISCWQYERKLIKDIKNIKPSGNCMGIPIPTEEEINKAVRIMEKEKEKRKCPLDGSTKCYCDPRPGFFDEEDE